MSSIKIAGILGKIFGEKETSPDISDRVGGIAAVSASSLPVYAGIEALGRHTGAKPIEQLQSVDDPVVSNVLDDMRLKKNMTAPLSEIRSEDMVRNNIPGDSAVYNKKFDKIHHSEKTPAHLVLHEAGHASNRDKPVARVLDKLNKGMSTHRTLGLATAVGLGSTENEHVQNAAPLAVAAVHTPNLLEEGRAWLNADQSLRNQLPRDKRNILKSFRGRGLGSLASYGLTAGANVAAAHKLPDIIDWISEQ